MTIVAPTPHTPLPAAPDPNDRATFDARAYAFNVAQEPFGDQMDALAESAYQNALDAQAKANLATTRRDEAAAQVVLAAGQVTLATEQAGIANTKAGQASASQLAAAQALADMQALYDQFDDRYLGARAADPALDNDGNPLQDGAFYINSVSGYLRAYTVAGGWVQGIASVAGVTTLNGQAGALTLKTINGGSVLGSGDLSIQGTPDFILMSQGVS